MNSLVKLFILVHLFYQNANGKANLLNLMHINEDCECGVKSDAISSRIVRGEKAKEHEYPFLVSIFYNGKLHCGGSLISDKYVLTAGHCLNWHDKSGLQVIVGMHDRVLMEAENKGGTVVEIDRLIVHEDFSSDYMHDSEDIALIKLKEPVQFNDFVTTVCLPFDGSEYTSGKATVAGWGKTQVDGTPSRLLLRTTVNLMTNQECRKVNVIGEHIIPTMLCAYEEGTDACQGDSGGPLFIKENNRTLQIGVVSWGVGCATIGVPGIYTKLTKYQDWIIAHTQDSKFCKDPGAKKLS